MKSQNLAGATVLDDPKLDAGNRERPNKRALVAHLCKEWSSTPSTAAFAVFSAERKDYRSCCEAFALENQCISGLAAETKQLRETLADCEKADAASKIAPKCRGKKFATTADKCVSIHKTEPANANASHS